MSFSLVFTVCFGVKNACALFHGAKLLKIILTDVYFLPKNVYFLTLVYFGGYFFSLFACVCQKKAVILQSERRYCPAHTCPTKVFRFCRSTSWGYGPAAGGSSAYRSRNAAKDENGCTPYSLLLTARGARVREIRRDWEKINIIKL